MSVSLNFGLNHMAAPAKSYEALFDLANELGISDVEIRNDLAGQAILDGTKASVVGAAAKSRGLKIISINALQRFNDWSPKRADEAKALADYAKECGALALVMCPVNDTAWQPETTERLAKLRAALQGLMPILADAGITGLVEPLGFVECSLRLKSEAVAAIDAVGGAARFKLVHDTFHHFVAGERDMFPLRTGLVHISGVDDAAVGADVMRDPHRVLVDGRDTIDNVGQIKALMAGGYSGPVSFEPFSDKVHQIKDIAAALSVSMAFIMDKVQAG